MNVQREDLPIVKELAPKLLSDRDCWVTLSEGRPARPAKAGEAAIEAEEPVRVRIDYMTAAQDSEYHRCRLNFESFGFGMHSEDYFLRATIKEITGLQFEGEPFLLEHDRRGLAVQMEKAEDPPDLISMLKAVHLYDMAIVKIHPKLAMTETDKKKQPTEPTSSAKAEASSESNSSPGPELLMAGTPSKSKPGG